ncbi:MAG: hypothetical protein QXH41_06700 [Metallosphaera sp.]
MARKISPTEAADAWKTHAIEAAPIWASNLNTAAANNAYAAGVAAFLGADPNVVASSYPVARWNRFATSANAQTFSQGVSATDPNKWLNAYRQAYSTPSGMSPMVRQRYVP